MTAGHIPGIPFMVKIHKGTSSNVTQGQIYIVIDKISFCCLDPE